MALRLSGGVRQFFEIEREGAARKNAMKGT